MAYPNTKISAKKSPYWSNFVDEVAFSIGTKTGGNITAELNFQDPNYTSLGTYGLSGAVDAYYSSTADGQTPVAAAVTTAQGANGAIIPIVTGKIFKLISNAANGLVDVVITGVTSTTYYLVVVKPDGGLIISPPIAF